MKRNSCFLTILIVLCIVTGLLIWVPVQADRAFGVASPRLSYSQKFLLSLQLLQSEENLKSPVDPLASDIPFQIDLGESPDSVADRLQSNKLIHNSRDFRNFLIYTGLDTKIQAGSYLLNPATPPIEIAIILMDATPGVVPFAILAGWRLEQVADSLPSSGVLISPDAFLRKARERNLEGYLLPGVYQVSRQITVTELFDILETAFEQAITPEMIDGFNAQGLSLDQAVRLASIVEREAIIDSERKLIASVFFNRLALGMKLEADPTVQYALGFNQSQTSWWTNPLSITDLQVDSPFNTYLYQGLPPGAICNSSLDSLYAVSQPAQTNYYYFRASCENNGKHNFAKSYQEHLENGCP